MAKKHSKNVRVMSHFAILSLFLWKNLSCFYFYKFIEYSEIYIKNRQRKPKCSRVTLKGLQQICPRLNSIMRKIHQNRKIVKCSILLKLGAIYILAFLSSKLRYCYPKGKEIQYIVNKIDFTCIKIYSLRNIERPTRYSSTTAFFFNCDVR